MKGGGGWGGGREGEGKDKKREREERGWGMYIAVLKKLQVMANKYKRILNTKYENTQIHFRWKEARGRERPKNKGRNGKLVKKC